MIAALITLMMVAVVGMGMMLILLVVAALFGLVFAGLAMAFKVLPIVLVGWLVIRYLKRSTPTSVTALAASDERWLDTPR